ncbi:hypothetical protein FEZ18_03385 [Oceanihabitans sp. IOP_32]|uniref:hypothetical protein n=1 Tax=Oceanihabitans sp. IOP_32 TaxID=2529032 RepID=UPI001293556A|nr:hypothetical protein [Oceanihabitans sp. IOP_32]QFZ53920.1 hypothetical protein FEZ18_03385 [Oceanihabitans sp. IOP_32]
MFKLKTWGALALCIAALYVFITFDTYLNDDFLNKGVGNKRKLMNLIVYTLAENKFGYWFVRCIPLVPAYIFGASFVKNLKK